MTDEELYNFILCELSKLKYILSSPEIIMSKDEYKRIKVLEMTNKNLIINNLKYMNNYFISIDTSKLNNEDKKLILSYVYDLIITLDDLVNELEKDN